MKKTLIASLLIAIVAVGIGLYSIKMVNADSKKNNPNSASSHPSSANCVIKNNNWSGLKNWVWGRMIKGQVASIATNTDGTSATLKISFPGDDPDYIYTDDSNSRNSFPARCIKVREFTVIVSAGDILANRVWDKITLRDIKVGDMVQFYGIASNTTSNNNFSVDAKLLRNLSLPIKPTPTPLPLRPL